MNIFKNISFLFVFMMAVISCTLPAAEEARFFENQQPLKLETLYGFKLGKESIIISVMGTGCTQEEHFYLHTSPTAEGYDVSIIRTVPDRCRRAPMLQQIRIPLDPRRKNDHFRLLNSVKMKP